MGAVLELLMGARVPAHRACWPLLGLVGEVSGYGMGRRGQVAHVHGLKVRPLLLSLPDECFPPRMEARGSRAVVRASGLGDPHGRSHTPYPLLVPGPLRISSRVGRCRKLSGQLVQHRSIGDIAGGRIVLASSHGGVEIRGHHLDGWEPTLARGSRVCAVVVGG